MMPSCSIGLIRIQPHRDRIVRAIIDMMEEVDYKLSGPLWCEQRVQAPGLAVIGEEKGPAPVLIGRLGPAKSGTLNTGRVKTTRSHPELEFVGLACV